MRSSDCVRFDEYVEFGGSTTFKQFRDDVIVARSWWPLIFGRMISLNLCGNPIDVEESKMQI